MRTDGSQEWRSSDEMEDEAEYLQFEQEDDVDAFANTALASAPSGIKRNYGRTDRFTESQELEFEQLLLACQDNWTRKGWRQHALSKLARAGSKATGVEFPLSLETSINRLWRYYDNILAIVLLLSHALTRR